MSGRVDADPDSLERLRDSLLTVRDQQLEALDDISREATEILEALTDEVARCQSDVEEARGALKRCRAAQAVAAATGDYVDCSQHASALEQAERRLETVSAALRAVDTATAEYQRAAHHHRAYLDEAIPTMRVGLQRRAQSLDAYLAWSVQQRRGSGLSSAGPSNAGSGMGSSGASETLAPTLGTHRDVPLELVEEPEFATGEWEEANQADMRASFERLPSVQRAIANGELDALVAADPSSQRAYEWFYGGDAVRLDWHEGKYLITGGKHRVELARRLGLSYIPAVVTGRE